MPFEDHTTLLSWASMNKMISPVKAEEASDDRQACGQDFRKIIGDFRPNLDQFVSIYKDIHQHPELSCQESRTADVAAAHLRKLGYEVHESIGGTGVVGVLQNGKGKIVLLRSELDALPVKEETKLPYASHAYQIDDDGEKKPVMHACGHDMHIACLMAAATLLHAAKSKWSGTVICLFQPNEERSGGAKAMIEDGLYDKIPVPDMCLAQHVVPLKSGITAIRTGPVMAATDSFHIRLFGRGGHAAEPQVCVDPVLLASSIVVRLQSIVARELPPGETAIVTCGSLRAGDAYNVIPDFADLKVEVRSFKPEIQSQAIASMKRIVEKECEIAESPKPPTFQTMRSCPSTQNEPDVTKTLTESFKSYLGDEAPAKLWHMEKDTACEDFSILTTPKGSSKTHVPYVYWNFGGIEPKEWDKAKADGRIKYLPHNHSALFAPAIEPTMTTGVDMMAVAALTFLETGHAS